LVVLLNYGISPGDLIGNKDMFESINRDDLVYTDLDGNINE